MRRLLFAQVAAVALLFTGTSRAADFTLGFDAAECGTTITGDAGTEKTFVVFSTLTTANNTLPDGAQGWSLSVAVDGPLGATTPITATVKGVVVSTVYDEDDDGDPGTPPIHHDPFDFDLQGAFTNIAARATLATDPTKLGAISAVVLKSQEKMVLQPNGKAQILKLTVKAVIPAAATPLTFSYVNGYKSTVSLPVNNIVTYNRASVKPEFTSCTITLGPAGGGCTGVPDYAFYFGATATGTAFAIPAAGGDGKQHAPVSLRNKGIALGFSLGIKQTAAALAFDGSLGSPVVELIVTKDDGKEVSGDGLKGNGANGIAGTGAISKIEKGAAIAAITGDFFGARILSAAQGGPGATVGYVADATGNNKSIPPVVDGASCGPNNEVLLLEISGEIPPAKFSRGDANGDGRINVTDGVIMAQNIFANKLVAFDCKDMLDANDDGALNTADPMYLLTYIFSQGPAPAAPFKACAADPTNDALQCAQANCQ
jgi:hypothetical protein